MECSLYRLNRYRKATLKREASNLEGVLSLYNIESIQKSHTEERAIQSGGGVLLVQRSNTEKATQKSEASNLEGVLSLYLESIQYRYTEERDASNLEGVFSL